MHDDRTLFEFLILEGAQAGLSWETILKKRENYRAAFDNFDAHKVARYDRRKVARLLKNPGIVRNRLKIAAAVQNAQALLRVQEEGDALAKANVFRRREASRRFPCEGLRYSSRFCLRSAGRRAGLGCPPGQYPCEARLQRQGDGPVTVQIGR